MSKMSVSVEFLAGTSIGDAITEAKQKALEWDVAYVCFKFNGVSLSVGRNTDVFKLSEEFREAIGTKMPFVVGW